MPHHQISIWDNEPLEEGYRQLSLLNFQEADRNFHEAAHGYAADTDELQSALIASRFWQSQMEDIHPTSDDFRLADHLEVLLLAFQQYPFTTALKSFRKALSQYIVSLFYQTDKWKERHLFTLFNLLLEHQEYSRAEDLIQRGMALFPENLSLLCLHSQVLWRSRKVEQAKRINIQLFLHHPTAVLKNRIEDISFLTLMDKHGVYMTPAYAWLYNVAPYVPLSNNIIIQNEDHRIALECYRLIHLSDQALSNHDLQESIRCRKKLKRLAPEFYQLYYKRLNNR